MQNRSKTVHVDWCNSVHSSWQTQFATLNC